MKRLIVTAAAVALITAGCSGATSGDGATERPSPTSSPSPTVSITPPPAPSPTGGYVKQAASRKVSDGRVSAIIKRVGFDAGYMEIEVRMRNGNPHDVACNYSGVVLVGNRQFGNAYTTGGEFDTLLPKAIAVGVYRVDAKVPDTGELTLNIKCWDQHALDPSGFGRELKIPVSAAWST